MAIDIRRRELLVTFGGTAAWAFTARAQQVAKLWRIGYLAESQRQVDEIFRQSLRKLGYIEGSNLTMIYRWAQGGSFEPLADDLVAQDVDLIVAVASPATRAVKERTTRIPIVIVDVGDPVAYGFVPSLAHPGGNITGMSMQMLEIGVKGLAFTTRFTRIQLRRSFITLPTAQACSLGQTESLIPRHPMARPVPHLRCPSSPRTPLRTSVPRTVTRFSSSASRHLRHTRRGMG